MTPQMTLPPELEAENRRLQRQQRIAEALNQQGMAPLESQMAGGYVVPISPLAGAAKLLAAYGANKKGREVEQGYQDIGRKYNEGLADAVRSYTQGGTRTVMAPDMGAMTGSLDEQDAPMATAQVPVDPRERMVAAMVSPYAPVRNLAALDFQTAQKEKELTENRAFRQSESQAAREARAAEQEAARAAAAERMRQEQAFRDQQARQAAQDRENLARVAAGLRPAPQPGAPVAVQDPNNPGQTIYVSPTDAVGKRPAAGGGKPMSATAQKELIETDEQIQGGTSALELFRQAKLLNDKAMGFTGAGALASAGSLLPSAIRPDAVNATQDLDNILQSAALPQLKAIFGGMPTEGERKILLDVQGSSNKPPEVRKNIFDRAEKAIQARIKFAQDKAKSLRSGSYFAGDGGVNPGAPAAPAQTGNEWGVVR